MWLMIIAKILPIIPLNSVFHIIPFEITTNKTFLTQYVYRNLAVPATWASLFEILLYFIIPSS